MDRAQPKVLENRWENFEVQPRGRPKNSERGGSPPANVKDLETDGIRLDVSSDNNEPGGICLIGQHQKGAEGRRAGSHAKKTVLCVGKKILKPDHTSKEKACGRCVEKCRRQTALIRYNA